jgi:hypothetical protein
MGKDNYDGILLRPDIDFAQVRDGRRSGLFYYDVDLSVIHNQSNGTHIVVPIAGNSFYVDKNPALIGNATVHFQDSNFGTAPAPVFCEPGFIAKVPFTQIFIENVAQPGKVFRIHYGVDIDFQPGASSSVTVNGNVNVVDNVPINTQHIYSGVGVPIGRNVVQLLAPGVNINGAFMKGIFGRAGAIAAAGAEITTFCLASLTVPVDEFTAANRIMLGVANAVGSASAQGVDLYRENTLSRPIPAGWGIYAVDVGVVAAGSRFWSLELAL